MRTSDLVMWVLGAAIALHCGSSGLKERRCDLLAGDTGRMAHTQGDWCLWRDGGAWHSRRMSTTADKLAPTFVAP